MSANPLIGEALKLAAPLAIALINSWRNSAPDVTIEEWMESFGRGRDMEQIYEDARQRHMVGVSIGETPAATVAPAQRRVATASEIVDAAKSGVIPNWFSKEEAIVTRRLYEDLQQ